MEETTRTDAVNNIDDGNQDAATVAVHNEVEVKVPLPPPFLPVGLPFVDAPPSTTASAVPVSRIVEGQTSNYVSWWTR